MRRVKGKVAILTGAALGIGRATAILLAKEGAKVAITDLRDKEGKDLAKRINDEGDEAGYWHLDVARERKKCGASLKKSTSDLAGSTFS